MSSKNTMIIAVYGTLMKGYHNHILIDGVGKFMGKAKGEFYATMFSAGGFPILSFNEPDAQPLVELYEMPLGNAMDRVDRLEGYPDWYNRTERTFITEDGEKVRAYIYHQNTNGGNMPVVPDCDWRKYRGAA